MSCFQHRSPSSELYRVNKAGPSMLPWGTPLVKVAGSDIAASFEDPVTTHSLHVR